MENPFAVIVNQLSNLNSKLDKVLLEREKPDAELLTLGEYAKAVKRSKQTILKWEKENKVKPVLVAGVKYYRNPNK